MDQDHTTDPISDGRGAEDLSPLGSAPEQVEQVPGAPRDGDAGGLDRPVTQRGDVPRPSEAEGLAPGTPSDFAAPGPAPERAGDAPAALPEPADPGARPGPQEQRPRDEAAGPALARPEPPMGLLGGSHAQEPSRPTLEADRLRAELRAVTDRLERAVARLSGRQGALLTRLDDLGRQGRVQSRTALRRGNG